MARMRDMITYNRIKHTLLSKEICISSVLELLKTAKKDIRQWENFVKNNLEYNIEDTYFCFDTEFIKYVKIAIEELEEYKEWKLIKSKNLSDIVKCFEYNILGEEKGSFSFDKNLWSIQVFIRYFLNSQNYCLIKFDE